MSNEIQNEKDNHEEFSTSIKIFLTLNQIEDSKLSGGNLKDGNEGNPVWIPMMR